MKRSGIYLVTHLASCQRYVGQSADLDRRLKEHSKAHPSSGLLCKAVKKHGWAAFEVSILEECVGDDALNAAEIRWIEFFDCVHPKGYNLMSGGMQGRVITDEVRARMSAAKKGIPKSPETRAKMSEAARRNLKNIARFSALSSKNQSAETRAKISAGNKGKVRSAEVRARISATKRAQGINVHLNITPETRARISAGAKAWRDDRARQAMERSMFDEAEALRANPFEGDFGDQGDKVLKDYIATARKARPCQDCADQIAPGTRVRLLSGRFDGQLRNYAWCAGCCAAMAAARDDGGNAWERRIANRKSQSEVSA